MEVQVSALAGYWETKKFNERWHQADRLAGGSRRRAGVVNRIVNTTRQNHPL